MKLGDILRSYRANREEYINFLKNIATKDTLTDGEINTLFSLLDNINQLNCFDRTELIAAIPEELLEKDKRVREKLILTFKEKQHFIFCKEENLHSVLFSKLLDLAEISLKNNEANLAQIIADIINRRISDDQEFIFTISSLFADNHRKTLGKIGLLNKNFIRKIVKGLVNELSIGNSDYSGMSEYVYYIGIILFLIYKFNVDYVDQETLIRSIFEYDYELSRSLRNEVSKITRYLIDNGYIEHDKLFRLLVEIVENLRKKLYNTIRFAVHSEFHLITREEISEFVDMFRELEKRGYLHDIVFNELTNQLKRLARSNLELSIDDHVFKDVIEYSYKVLESRKRNLKKF